jgi:1-acyl-sn-glycerol-3-phosphate acyltransferase
MRHLLRIVASAWCWIVLTCSITVGFLVGIVLAPFTGMVRAMSVVMTLWGRISMFAGFYKCQVEGREHLAKPGVIVANHRSIFDICLLACLVPRPYFFVARAEVFKVPLIGWILKLGGHIPVVRGSAEASRASLEKAVQLVAQGGRVLFFPEGSRSKDGLTRPWKSGAFHVAAQSGTAVIPVAIAGSEHSVRKGSGFILPARIAVRVFSPMVVNAETDLTSEFRERIRQKVDTAVLELSRHCGPRV